MLGWQGGGGTQGGSARGSPHQCRGSTGAFQSAQESLRGFSIFCRIVGASRPVFSGLTSGVPFSGSGSLSAASAAFRRCSLMRRNWDRRRAAACSEISSSSPRSPRRASKGPEESTGESPAAGDMMPGSPGVSMPTSSISLDTRRGSGTTSASASPAANVDRVAAATNAAAMIRCRFHRFATKRVCKCCIIKRALPASTSAVGKPPLEIDRHD